MKKITGHSLVKALTRVKDLNIQEKKSTVEKKRTVRNNYRKFKETVEKEWQSTFFCQVNAYILGLVIKYGVKHGLFNGSNDRLKQIS